jgi:hypothetical protein
MEEESTMKWKKINFLFENKEIYKFEIGCNVLKFDENLICAGRNYLIDEKNHNNDYFRVDKLNLVTQQVDPLFNSKDGPRFRLTNVSII